MTKEPIVYGCLDPKCGWRCSPSTLPTNYVRCPSCGGGWAGNPPEREKGVATDGKVVKGKRGR